MDKKNNKEKITTINELAMMINSGFQNNQEYMDKKFGELKNELTGEIHKVDTKLTTFIDEYNSEKLPMRVEYIENVLNLHKK